MDERNDISISSDLPFAILPIWNLDSESETAFGSVSSTSFTAESMQPAQFRFGRFIFGEFHEVAAFEKPAQAFLLFADQQIRSAEFVQKFLRRAFGRAKLKTLFQVSPGRVRNRDDKRLRLRNQRQCLLQFLFRANVRRNGRHNWNLGHAPVP